MPITPAFAKSGAVVTLSGGDQVQLRPGDHYPDDDPLVLGHPDLFSSDPRYGLRWTARPAGLDEPSVEAATAAPGERRSTSRSRG